MDYRPILDWSNGKTLELIELYKSHPMLWDRTHELYKSTLKKDAWSQIAAALDTDVDEIKKKMNSVLASFRRERQRERVKRTKNNQFYKSNWFAFKALSFLLNRDDLGAKNEMEDHGDEYEDDESDKDPLSAVEVEISQDEHPTQYTHSQQISDENLFSGSKFDTVSSRPTVDHGELRNSSFYNMDAVPNTENYKQKGLTAKRRRTQTFPPEMTIGDVYTVCQAINTSRDECSVFGEYVANKVRSLDSHQRRIAEHTINNILFAAEMGYPIDARGFCRTQGVDEKPQARGVSDPTHGSSQIIKVEGLIED